MSNSKDWVHVGPRDLERSFRDHADAADRISGVQAHLLLFYAVECGLKGAALRRIKGQSTRDLPAQAADAGHDLRKLAKHLKIPPALTVDSAYPDCERQAADKPKVGLKQWHEAWRYGAILKPEHENIAVATLNNLRQWCDKEAKR